MRTSFFRQHVAIIVFAAAVPVFSSACGSDPPPAASVPASAPTAPSATPDACNEIAKACHQHDKDGGGAAIHECHELGHAHKLEACVARRTECLDMCAGHAH